MRVAIIGGGVSGLVAAMLLARRHDVTVFESENYPGGHTHTVSVATPQGAVAVDTGFIVFNDRTYPSFTGLLDRLGVASRDTEMSFSVRCDRTGLEYNGTSLNGLFADRRQVVSPPFLGMLRDIARFNRDGAAQAAGAGDASVGTFLDAHGYGQRFREHYLLPMGASIWSCPTGTFLEFPIGFVLTFFANHGLMQLRDRPTWKVVRGGSARYVDAILDRSAARVWLSTPVSRIRRHADHVDVASVRGVERFDEVVLACHADQALTLLDDPSMEERRLLGAFPYATNTAVLHTDATWLPRRRRAWASWNYRVPAGADALPVVTYHMNRLQHLQTEHEYCVTLNPATAIAPGAEIARYTYAHPIFSAARIAAQTQHDALIRRHRTSYCGAYWGYGFHEDGVRSALAVTAAFGEGLD
ncbi:MAG: FAD-dependent oxidoreductase [Vicinamibacteraceae bacterium]